MTKIYHTKMADALPSKKRVAEEKARLEKAGIKYILSCWIDMLGLPKTKPIPFAEFEALGLTDLELRKEVNELRNATNQLKLVFQRNV